MINKTNWAQKLAEDRASEALEASRSGGFVFTRYKGFGFSRFWCKTKFIL